ncbi:MAG: Zn-binding domain-containing protein [Bacteroidota bacterium]
MIDLDLERRQATLAPTTVDYFTEATQQTEVEVIEMHQERRQGDYAARLGELRVTTRVTGYRRRRNGTGTVLGHRPLDLPATALQTVGFWLVFPRRLLRELTGRGRDPAGGLHGLEHLLIGLLPLDVLCDRWDVAGTSTILHPATDGPTVFIYDAASGGAGFAERAYLCLAGLLERAAEALAACPCLRGCPSCIQSPKCGSYNQPLDKEATKEFLQWMKNQAGAETVLPE